MNSKVYKSLVLSGGAQKGFILLGAIRWCEDHNRLSVSELVAGAGTSVGSILLFLLLLGWTPLEILHYGMMTNSWIPWQRTPFHHIWHHHGLVDIQDALTPLKNKLIERHGRWDYTFQDLHDMGKEFHVVAANATTSSEVVYNYRNCPTMVCMDAIGKSCNIPGIFTANVDGQGHMIIDGGAVNAFPWTYIRDCPSPLGIAIYDDDQQLSDRLEEYFIRCVSLSINRLIRISIEEASQVMPVIDIPYGGSVPLVQNLSSDDKCQLFKEGYQWMAMMDTSFLVEVSVQK